MGGVDMDLVRETHEALRYGADYLKLKPGKNTLRILPPWGNKKAFWVEYDQCWGVGPNKKKVVLHSEESDPNHPMVAYLEALKASEDEASKKRYEANRRKARVAMFAVRREDEGAQKPKLFDTNRRVFKKILTIMLDPDYGDISDPEKGVDIVIHYTPKEENKETGGQFPGWEVQPRRHSTPLGTPPQVKAWLEEDLFERYRVGKPSDPDYVRAVLAGEEQEWIAARRAAGQQVDAHDDSDDNTPPAPADEEAPAQASTKSAIDRELERVRQKAAEEKATDSAPPPPTDTPAPPPPKESRPSTPDDVLGADYWVVENGQSVAKKGPEVQAMLDAGQEKFNVMRKGDPNKQWSQSPLELGFLKSAPKSQVTQDLEDALK